MNKWNYALLIFRTVLLFWRSEMKLEIGKKYKWKHEPQILTYVGKSNGWHQFALVNTDELWCEVLDFDLHLMEEV